MTRLAVAVILLPLLAGVATAAGTLDIYFIDVEGGQATLIVTPAGESILIDAGSAGRGGRGRRLSELRAAPRRPRPHRSETGRSTPLQGPPGRCRQRRRQDPADAAARGGRGQQGMRDDGGFSGGRDRELPVGRCHVPLRRIP